MGNPDEPAAEPTIESFLGEATQDLGDWRWLWKGDHRFPARSHRPGLAGRVVLAFKRLLRPLVQSPQADLWDRQRTFNQVLLFHLNRLQELQSAIGRLDGAFDDLGSDLQRVQEEILSDLRSVQAELIKNDVALRERIEPLEEFKRQGMKDLMLHTDALFARLDQKLDRSRRLLDELKDRAG